MDRLAIQTSQCTPGSKVSSIVFVFCQIEANVIAHSVELVRSQDFEKRFHDSGQFYWSKVSSLENDKKLFTKKSGAIVISELEAQDIDTETDWKLAEIKYKLLLENDTSNL